MELSTDVIKLIETTYRELKTSMANDYKGLIDIGRAIGGIGALIYIITKIWGSLLRSEPIDFVPLIRPFIILQLITFSNAFCESLDRVGEGVMQISNTSVGQMSLKIQEAIKKREQALQKGNENAKDKNEATFTEQDKITDISAFSFLSELGAAYDQFTAKIELAIDKFLINILSAVHDVCYILMILVSVFFRLLLRVIAPIAFGIAIWDGFTNNIFEWVGKYLNYTFLPFAAGIYATIISKIEVIYLNAQLQDYTNNGEDSVTGILILMILSIVGYFFVPTAANMIISVGGVSQVTSGLGRMTSSTISSVKRETIGRIVK
jgi:conjugative transposon TraJ protein